MFHLVNLLNKFLSHLKTGLSVTRSRKSIPLVVSKTRASSSPGFCTILVTLDASKILSKAKLKLQYCENNSRMTASKWK